MYFIPAFTALVAWQLITTIIAQFSEEKALLFATCFVFQPLRLLFYPYRALRSYSRCKDYYQKHNISRLAYLFGKRARK